MSECHQMASGFGTYAKQLLPRLARTGKYELAEFAAYGHPDIEGSFDWTFYGNLPTNPRERQIYDQNPANSFGAWRFDQVALDFKPDIVLTYRDPWMDEWIAHSPSRRFFHWLWMPTVDSAPQQRRWLQNFARCDALLAYSEFGVKTLLEQSGDNLKVIGCAPPAVDPEVYKPVPSFKSHRESFGLDPDIKIIGTVMRNQKRKLFIELMRAFRIFLDKAPKELAEKSFLYLHTSYPERNGWDIPLGIQENNLHGKVLATYVCRACGKFHVTKFQDAITTCKHCGARAAVMPNVSNGLSIPDLIKVYNLMDLYVQYAICEGFGMPQVEAASCGVPIASVDYSAMEDVVRFANGYPVKIKHKYREMETGADRVYPDNNHMADIMLKHLSLSDSDMARKRMLTRKGTTDRYNWDKTAAIWEEYIDTYTPVGYQGKWDAPYQEIGNYDRNAVPEMTNENLVRWSYSEALKKPEHAFSFETLEWIQSLNVGAHILTGDPVTRESFWQMITQRADNARVFEMVRCGLQQMTPYEFITKAHARRNK